MSQVFFLAIPTQDSNLMQKTFFFFLCIQYNRRGILLCAWIAQSSQVFFHNKSYTAYKLRRHMNYTHFLGLKPMETTQRLLGIRVSGGHTRKSLRGPQIISFMNGYCMSKKLCPFVFHKYTVHSKSLGQFS